VAALEEAGDLVIPIKEGLITDARVTGEIGQVLNHDLPGREKNEEITIFKTVGFAALDMIVAQLVYEHALVQDFGREIDLSK
jgi:ornithine cyclodeaminase